MGKSIVVVGLQWGDEGKGKIIDFLSDQVDLIVRSQGGSNAGHTIMVNGKEHKFHLVPSGALNPRAQCFITAGTVIDLSVLATEIDTLTRSGIILDGRLSISERAHVIMPYHLLLDRLYEKQKGGFAVGTTGRGIGPCYADKALRVGFQLGELKDPYRFKMRLQSVLTSKNQEITKIFDSTPFDADELAAEYLALYSKISPFIAEEIEINLAKAIDIGKNVLFEGAHGSLLDTTFGTYPYVTSSSTLSSAVAAAAGIGPTRIHHTLGIVKAYTTRVGNGPLPSALSEDELSLFKDNITAREVGTTTGRNRRLGWFDVPLIRQSILINGVDSLAIMKLDILDDLTEVKICVGYRISGEIKHYPPALSCLWSDIEPVYEVMQGWCQKTYGITEFDDLPHNAQSYVKRIQQLCGCAISLVSTGPDRSQTISLVQLFGE